MEKETCSTHTKEKENSGTCCQVKEKENSEQQTYEYKPKTDNFKSGEVIVDDTDECEWCQ
jgi:hypothetical protein